MNFTNCVSKEERKVLEEIWEQCYLNIRKEIWNCWYWKIIFNQDDSLPRLDEYSWVSFDGRSIILIGDFGQLPPILDELMHSQIYHLGIVQHQSDEQRKFRDLLLHLHDGESTENDESTEDG
ncbi:hypothetical protein RhiirA4_546039 [Rhizophagus irregularis]|uniref:ATP-dependent DNA helicase n=1 Tax=Rhizophagus irregularis TaxID=588596 RepID=A0A2I1GVB1_9GLOM|nr:hypothetical protein RhiirA4_546039 [Rhizophagus irregularis]